MRGFCACRHVANPRAAGLPSAVAEAELTRFIKADLNADRFSLSVDDDAIAEAELFDGKLALITNAPNLAAAEAVARYKGLRTSSAASVS